MQLDKTMNKLFVFILFFTSLVFSQNKHTLADSLSVEQYNGISKIDSDNIKNKYSDLNYEPITNLEDLSAWERFKENLSRWWNSLFNNSNEATDAFYQFFKIISFAIVAVVVYLIIKQFIKNDNKWIFSKNNKSIVASDLVEENLHDANFEKLIKQANANGEYRLTVRYYYLWMLKQFSDKEIIKWDIEKTNSDYQYEIKDAALKEEFNYLSYLYDYCWYGEFDINKEQIAQIEKAFAKTINIK